jgi:site-specific recombinase XerD
MLGHVSISTTQVYRQVAGSNGVENTFAPVISSEAAAAEV